MTPAGVAFLHRRHRRSARSVFLCDARDGPRVGGRIGRRRRAVFRGPRVRRVDFFRRRVRLRPESILVGRLASLRVNPDVVRGDRGGLVHRRERRRQRRRLPREIAVRVGDDRAHLRVSLRMRTPSRLGRVLARRGRRSRPRLRRDLIDRTRSHGLVRHRFAARGLPPAARHERESTTRWSCSKAGPSTPSTPKKPSSRWGTKARLARLPSRGARLNDGMSHALDARDRCPREFAMRRGQIRAARI